MDRLPSRDHRAKTPKKKTKNRRVLIQNLKKARSRKEDRCAFQLIPYPSKFAGTNRIYYLPGDVALMEINDNLVAEASLYNPFKTYKHAQVVEYPGQKMLKIKMETKNIPYDDWREVVEKLSNSESSNLKEWGSILKKYYERYEAALEKLKTPQEVTPEKIQALKEMNERNQKIRQTVIKSYPCIEFRVELKDGQIQMTQFSITEKYANQIGYTLESFAATALEEGIPEVTPLNSPGAVAIAKLRMERGVSYDHQEFQSKEYESTGIMKNGYIKKARVRAHFLTVFEKGVLGFLFIGAILTKLKPEIDCKDFGERPKVNPDFVDMMAERENETKTFLSAYYNQAAEQKYTNLYKTCGIKEIENVETFE